MVASRYNVEELRNPTDRRQAVGLSTKERRGVRDHPRENPRAVRVGMEPGECACNRGGATRDISHLLLENDSCDKDVDGNSPTYQHPCIETRVPKALDDHISAWIGP